MGGKETFTMSLAGAQQGAGMHAGLATFDPGNAFEGELRELQLPWWRFSRKGALDWSLVASLRKLVADEGFALVHCHGENPAMYGALAVAGRPIPLVATIHSGDRDGIRLIIKIQNRFTYLRTNSIVCVSDSIRDRLIRKEFAPAGKMTTIFNGVTPPRRPEADQAARLRGELSVGPGNLVVACIGRLHPVKNHLRFLEAFAQARAAESGLVLLMVGDGPLREEVAAKVGALGIEASVRLLGTRKDVGHILAISDIFALPSLNEGHSISLLEACSFGKSILASNRGGNPGIVSHGKSGLLVEPGDTEGMAGALIRLAKDPDLRKSLGAEASKVYRERFSMERCLGEYTRLYARLSPAFSAIASGMQA